MKRLSAFLLVLLLSACSPKIDGTSERAFNESVQIIMKEMSAEEMQEFRADLRRVGQYLGQKYMEDRGLNPITASLSFINDPNAMTEILIQGLHGKTASDVRKMADEWEKSKK